MSYSNKSPKTDDEIHRLLMEALSPTFLAIEDDGHLHIGHRPPGSRGGHYTVHIASPHFAGKSLRECHQQIYKVLEKLMDSEIHALGIKIQR